MTATQNHVSSFIDEYDNFTLSLLELEEVVRVLAITLLLHVLALLLVVVTPLHIVREHHYVLESVGSIVSTKLLPCFVLLIFIHLQTPSCLGAGAIISPDCILRHGPVCETHHPSVNLPSSELGASKGSDLVPQDTRTPSWSRHCSAWCCKLRASSSGLQCRAPCFSHAVGTLCSTSSLRASRIWEVEVSGEVPDYVEGKCIAQGYRLMLLHKKS